MSWFYTSQVPGTMDPDLRGPYADQSAAQAARADELVARPTVVCSDPFEQSADYHLPRQVMIVARDGVDYCVYEDGSEKQRIMP